MWQLLFRVIQAVLRGGRSASLRLWPSMRIRIVGLIRNRPLTSLTHQEIRNALANAGLREAHNAHFVSRLIERGPQFGIRTLADFERAFNAGVARAAGNTVEVVLPGGRAAIVVNEAGRLVTFLPL